MQIFISKAFSSKLASRKPEQMKVFNERINELKSKNKSSIIESKETIDLTSNKNITVYAYYIEPSVYVLFAFKEKNEIVLLDEIRYISKNEIESLVYGNMRNDETPNDSEN